MSDDYEDDFGGGFGTPDFGDADFDDDDPYGEIKPLPVVEPNIKEILTKAELDEWQDIDPFELDPDYHADCDSHLFEGLGENIWSQTHDRRLMSTTKILGEFTFAAVNKLTGTEGTKHHFRRVAMQMIDQMLALHNDIQTETIERANAMRTLAEDRLRFKQQRDILLKALERDRAELQDLKHKAAMKKK